MVTTIRELCIQNIETTLEGITTGNGYDNNIGTVDRNNINPLQLRAYPAALIIPEFDDPETAIGGASAPFGKTTRTFDVTIRLWVRGAKNPGQVLELFIGDAQKAMMSDLTRGGNALATREQGIGNVYSDEASMERGADLLFKVTYRHALTNPAAA